MPIINSLLDTDFYQFTQAQLLFNRYADVTGVDEFRCRNGTALPGSSDSFDRFKFMDRLNEEIDHLCTLKLNDDELSYLSNIPFFKESFIDYLRLLKLNRKHIKFWENKREFLEGRVEGPIIAQIWFETPVLAIISELLNNEFNDVDQCDAQAEGATRLMKNIELLNAFQKTVKSRHGDAPLRFADFGTRRRYSFDWQKYVLNRYIEGTPKGTLIGTSNVFLAKKLGLKPIGTMSHKLFQIFQQLGRPEDHIEACLDAWVHEYRGELGIALSDIVGFDAFLKDFDLYFAKLFDGCRHDSGNPYEWCRKLVKHYKDLGIDTLTKTAVFSDGLTIPKAIELHRAFQHVINVLFGIGTKLTNDMGIETPNIVIKNVECNGRPTAKIPDSSGKGMCKDKAFEAYLKHIFNIS